MTIQLLTKDRQPLRQIDYQGDKLPHLIRDGGATFHAIGENPRTHLHEYACTKRVVVATLLLLALWATPALAQLPQTQVFGQDSGTLRAVVVNASGQLSITCANCSGSGASVVDDAAFTVATDSAAPAAFLFDDTTPDSVDEGDAGIGRMSANRNQYVTIRDAAGNERGLNIDANGAIAVTGGGAGVQYTEADTDASITGTALLFEGAANALVAATGDATNGLDVDVTRVGGTVAVTQSGTWDEVGINDSGNSITVDGTVTVTDGAGALNVIVDSATLGTVTVSDGAGALNVICDSGCGAGTQYAEDAAHGTGDQTMFVSGVRSDTTPTSTAGTAGDYAGLNIDANGRLYVNAVLYTAAGAAATLASDTTVGSAIGTSGPLGMAVYSEFDGAALPTITNVNTEGEGVPTAATLKGVQYVMVVSEDGSLERGTATTPMIVGDGTGALNVIVDSGTVTTVSTVTTLSQLGGTAVPIEDAAETAGGTGLYALSVRRDAAATSAGTDGDNATFNTDASGRLWVNPGVIGVEDAAETAGGGLAMAGAVVRSTAAGSSATAGDNATVNVDTLGRLWARDGNPCMDHARITTAAISNSTSGNVEVVGLNGSDLIYVCGYSLVAGAATGVRFVYGTGTACATGEAGITGIWSFAANGGITQANAGAPQFVVPAGNAFCTENSGANSIQGHVTYVRTASP